MIDDRPPSVLLVDDDDVFRSRMARALEERGYEVRTAAGAAEAIALARKESCEFAVVDLRMPGQSGLELIGALEAIDPATRIIILTGYGSIATALEAVRRGAAGYLTKPVDADDLVRTFDGQQEDCAPRDQVPSLDRVEWEHINRVLLDCTGNISRAARLLGIHRRSLQRKLAKHPLPR